MHSPGLRRTAPVALLMFCLAVVVAVVSPAVTVAAHAAVLGADERTTDSATAAKKVGFGIVPATADDLDVRALFSYGLTPGSVAYDHVAVVNYSRRPLKLAVYATDALNTSEGGFALRSASDRPSDLGAWVQVGDASRARTVNVPGRRNDGSPGRVILPVSITVPDNASPGDHAAGIIASLASLGKNPQGQNLRLEQRVASRVYVRVDGPAQPDLTVTMLSATYLKSDHMGQPGSVRVRYTITNGGNVRMGFAPSVEVKGPFGLGRTRVAGEPVAELLPGNQQTTRVTIPDIWPMGYLDVTVVAEPRASVAAAVPEVAPARETVRIWVLTWELLLVLLLLLALLVYLIVRAVRRRRRARAEQAAMPRVGGPAQAAGVPAARAGR